MTALEECAQSPGDARRARRVAIVVPDLRVGGLQEMAVRLLLSLDPDEFEPRVYTFDGGGPLADDLRVRGVVHVHLPRPAGIAPGYARELAEAFTRDGIELVHCHNVTALFHGARAAWRAGRIPVLFTEHDREMPAPWKHRVLHRWLARRATRVVAVSDRLRDALVQFEGFPTERTSTLVNGVPDPRTAFGGDRARARTELGWRDEADWAGWWEAPVALAVGSLTPVKNHAGLLRMMRAVRQVVPEARLALVGAGPLESALRSQVAEDLPAGAASLMGERRDVARLLAACDVFVLPSHSEGLSLSLIEAHGAGRPSLCFDVGGNREVIEAGATGWLVPPGDESAYAERLAGALADPQALEPLGAAARRRFEAAFTHDLMVQRYLRHYRELICRVES